MRSIGFGSLYPGMVGMSRGRRGGGASMAGVTKDATSGIYCPANATEWTSTMSAAGIGSGNPSLLWLLQESSGNVADSIGGFTGTATAGSPALAYAQVIAGWSRKGITGSDGSSGNITTTSTSLPDLSTTSMLVLAYASFSKPAALRNAMIIGTTSVSLQVNATPRVGLNNGALTAGASDPTVSPMPVVLQHNVTGTTQALYTLNDAITPTWNGTRTGKKLEIFSGAPMTYFYLAAFSGAAAEMTSTQIRTLLQTLGWSPTW